MYYLESIFLLTEWLFVKALVNDLEDALDPDAVGAVLVVARFVREEHVLEEGVTRAGHLDAGRTLVHLQISADPVTCSVPGRKMEIVPLRS